MAVSKWIDIRWEDKHYYQHTTSTSYGNPVKARIDYKPDRTIDPKSTYSDLGLKHFGFTTQEETNQTKAKKEKTKKEKPREGDDGGGKKLPWWAKVLLSPFLLILWILKMILKLVWWVIKLFLLIITFGLISNWLNDEK